MTELLLGLLLTALALLGFLFNLYIVLALVLTKQVGRTAIKIFTSFLLCSLLSVFLAELKKADKYKVYNSRAQVLLINFHEFVLNEHCLRFCKGN